MEECISTLEGTKYGLAFSSGMAAISAITSLLKKDENILLCNEVYGGTYKLFKTLLPRYGISTIDVDATRPKEIAESITGASRMIWLETPTNPLMTVLDITAIAKISRAHGLILVVDNTLASPYLQRPVASGADIVVEGTKYLAGHGDIIGGALATSDEALYRHLKFVQNKAGAVPSPFDCYLTLRGARTLHLRMERHSQNATEIAEMLERDSRVNEVNYPFLSTFAYSSTARSQMRLGGGNLSFRINGGFENARRFIKSLKLFELGVSLGSVSSLVSHPASMTHRSLPGDEKTKLKITDDLIRMSVGIENIGDLTEDIRGALDAAFEIDVAVPQQ